MSKTYLNIKLILMTNSVTVLSSKMGQRLGQNLIKSWVKYASKVRAGCDFETTLNWGTNYN